MLKVLSNTAEYIDFADDINSSSDFSVPVYSSAEELNQRLLDAPKQHNKLVLGYYEDGTIMGLFVLLVEEQDRYLEMLMPLSRSATAYGALAERYGVGLGEIAAFGDDVNDIEMLTACGVGVAVGNALPEVKAAADEVCGSNEEEGVARWIWGNVLT